MIEEENSNEIVSSITAKEKSRNTKRKAKLCQRLKTIIISTAVISFLVFLNIYFKNLYSDLFLLTKQVIEKRDISTFFSIFGLNAFLQMCFVPGISFFLMFIGYITKDYLYSIALVFPSSLVICVLTYVLTKYTIKNRLHKMLCRKWYFKVYYDMSLEKPWHTSAFLRILLIPVTYKNYLIALMNINFAQFIIPAAPYYLIYFSSYLVIGILISNIEDLMKGKIPDADKTFYYGLITFYSILGLLSIGMVIYLIILTARTYKKYKSSKLAKETKQDELLNSAL
jgi:hypothetical protein